MSLDKAIEHGKEHRKPFNHAKSVDKTCRNHGGRSGGSKKQCEWCLGNRTIKYRRNIEKSEYRSDE